MWSGILDSDVRPGQGKIINSGKKGKNRQLEKRQLIEATNENPTATIASVSVKGDCKDE